MMNAFAYRATDPAVMKAQPDAVGVDNDKWLVEMAKGAGIVIAAWGVHGVHNNRKKEVCALIKDLHCLGLTKNGRPRHPLYLSSNTKPVPFLPK